MGIDAGQLSDYQKGIRKGKHITREEVKQVIAEIDFLLGNQKIKIENIFNKYQLDIDKKTGKIIAVPGISRLGNCLYEIRRDHKMYKDAQSQFAIQQLYQHDYISHQEFFQQLIKAIGEVEITELFKEYVGI